MTSWRIPTLHRNFAWDVSWPFIASFFYTFVFVINIIDSGYFRFTTYFIVRLVPDPDVNNCDGISPSIFSCKWLS